MKKLLLVIMASALLAGCEYSGNYDSASHNKYFNYAYIYIQDGTIIKGKITSWKDYDNNDKVEIVMEDGKYYLVNSQNCTLIFDPALEPEPTTYETSTEETFEVDDDYSDDYYY